MASIEKRKGGWRIRWREGGQPRSHQCPTRKAAVDVRRQVEDAVARGEHWTAPALRREPTVASLMEAYLADRARVLAAGTVRVYAVQLDIVLGWLGSRGRRSPREVFSRTTLEELWTWTGEADRGLKFRREIVEGFRRVWVWSFDHEDYSDDVPRPSKIELPTPPTTPTLAPTWSDMDRAIAHLAAGSGYQRLAILMRCTGLRVWQAKRLRWDDVDLERREIIIRGELGKSRQERAGRIVPMAPVLATLLAGWGVREGLVAGVSADQYPAIRRAWTAAGVRDGIWRQRPHHAFRKGFVSELRRAGASSDAVEYLVGHSLGLVGVYTDPRALGLDAAVALVPPLGGGVVVPLRARGDR